VLSVQVRALVAKLRDVSFELRQRRAVRRLDERRRSARLR
jgi:hypothetical protein